MELIPSLLADAARAGRKDLMAAAHDVAAAGATSLPDGTRAMTRAARAAIFADALLGAMHARLQELKEAART